MCLRCSHVYILASLGCVFVFKSCVCICLWRPNASVWVLPQLLPILFFDLDLSPELTNKASLTRQLALGTYWLCLLRLELLGVATPTWHLCGFWGCKHFKSWAITPAPNGPSWVFISALGSKYFLKSLTDSLLSLFPPNLGDGLRIQTWAWRHRVIVTSWE